MKAMIFWNLTEWFQFKSIFPLQKSFLQTSLYHNSPVAGPPLRGGDGEPSRERRERRSNVSRSESKIYNLKDLGKSFLWTWIGKKCRENWFVKIHWENHWETNRYSETPWQHRKSSISSCRSEALKAGYQSRDDQKAVKSSNAAGAALWRQDVSASADTTNLPELRVDYS